MAELDQLNVSTRRFIADNPSLIDNVFSQDPFAAYLKLNCLEKFTGGTLIQEGFWFDALPGGSYQKGKEFNITEKQVEQAFQIVPKGIEVSVTMSLEDIKVFNKGPNAAFSLLDSRMTNAYTTMGIFLAISLYLKSATAGFAACPTGLAEALNDNTTVSWDNTLYATYGGITRGGQVGSALSSTPTNVNGAIQYPTLETTYSRATYGNQMPNLGVCSRLAYSYIKEKFQTQQRFNDTQDPAIGFNGLKFNAATLIQSRYAPGSDITTANSDENKVAVAYLTETSNGAVLAYPTLAVASSETLFWINARKPWIKLYITDDPMMGGGFTGFKPAQGNTKVTGQTLFWFALTVPSPRRHTQVYGITS